MKFKALLREGSRSYCEKTSTQHHEKFLHLTLKKICITLYITDFCLVTSNTDWRVIMQIQLDPNSELQLYKQLANQIIECIAQGELKNGDTLPSVRSMATDLGINVSTVSKSYHELEEKGLIELKPKAKAVIIGGQKRELEETEVEKVENALKPIMAEAFARGLEKEQMTSLFQRILKQWK